MHDGKLPRSEKGHIPGLEPEPADEYVHQEYPKDVNGVIVFSAEEEAALEKPEGEEPLDGESNGTEIV